MGLMDTIAEVANSLAGEKGIDQKTISGVLDLIKGSGGLKGLVDTFVKSGLGDVIESWVSTGKNRPINVSDIKKALGDDKLAEIASRAGIPADQVSKVLKDILPDIVDRVTPKGIIEED